MMENPTEKIDHAMEAGVLKGFFGYGTQDLGEVSRPDQDRILRVI